MLSDKHNFTIEFKIVIDVKGLIENSEKKINYEIDVSLASNKDFFDEMDFSELIEHDEMYGSLYFYLEEHYREAIKEITSQMIDNELPLLNLRGDFVNKSIKKIVNNHEKQIRKRLAKRRGRRPNLKAQDLIYPEKREKLITKFKKAYLTLKEGNKTVNKTNIANLIYRKDQTNKYKALQDELKPFRLTFESLIEIIENELKSSEKFQF